MAQRISGKSRFGVRSRPAPKRKAQKPVPAGILSPDFNHPPSAVRPKTKTRPKPQPKARVGPYTKPVEYTPGKKYPVGQPIYTPGSHHRQIEYKTRTGTTSDPSKIQSSPPPKAVRRSTSRAENIPKGQKTTPIKANPARVIPYGQKHPVTMSPVELASIRNANKYDFGQLYGEFGRELVGPDLINAVQGKSFSPVGLGLDLAGFLPFGKVGRVADVAEHIGQGMRAGHSADEILQGAKEVARYGKNPAPRRILVGETEYVGPASRSRVMRGLQRGLDAGAQRAIDRAEIPEVGQATSHLAAWRTKSLNEARRFYQGERERAAAVALRDASLGPARELPAEKTARKYALELVAHEVTPEQRIFRNEDLIAEHEASGDKKVADRLRKENELVARAAKYVKEVPVSQAGSRFPTRLKSGTTVVLNSQAGAKTHRAWDDLMRVAGFQGQRPQWAYDVKDFTLERELERLSAPGRFYRGAKVETPHASFITDEFAAKWANVPDPEIEKLIAGTEAKWQKLVELRYEDVPGKKAEQAWRNSRAQKLARKGLPRMQTVNEQAHAYAEKKAWELVESHPELAHIKNEVLEADRLKRLLEARQEARVFGGEVPTGIAKMPSPGMDVRIDRKYPGKIIALHGDKAEVWMYRSGQGAKPLRVTKPIAALEERLPERLVGAEDFTGGRAYIPSEAVGKKWFTKAYTTASEMLPAKVQGGSEFGKPYLAKLAAQGLEQHDPTRLVADAGLEMQRLHQAKVELDQIRKVALPHELVSDARGLMRGVGKHTSVFDKITGAGWHPIRITTAPLSHETNRSWIQMTLREMLPTEEEIRAIPPTDIAFVPRAMVGSLADRRVPSNAMAQVFGSISKLARLGIVYTKPGHVPPRFVSNMTMAVFQQGLDILPTSVATYKLWRYDPEVMRTVDRLMGVHSAYESVLAGRAEQGVNKLGNALIRPVAWSADKAPRRISFIYELTQDAGQKMTVPEMSRFLRGLINEAERNPGVARRLETVVQRAREAAGEYSRANSLERKIAPWIFLYQWGKVATKFAARSVVEHPYKSAGLAYLINRFGYHEGNRPWERFGVNVPGGKMVNYTTSIPQTTPYEYARDIATMAGKGASPYGESPLGMLNPLVELGMGIATGREPESGYSYKSNRFLGAGESFGRQTPPGALIAGKKSIQDRVTKFLFGNLAPTSPASGSNGGGLTPGQVKRLKKLGLSQKDINNINKEVAKVREEAAQIKKELQK